MGFFDKAEKLARPIDALRKFADVVSTTDEERLEAEAVIKKMELRQDELQVELNKVEAQSRSWFNSGWRPAIGWVCAVSLFLYFPIRFAVATIMWTAIWVSTGEIVAYPIGVEGLMELVLGMLGLGAFRTADKLAGRSK